MIEVHEIIRVCEALHELKHVVRCDTLVAIAKSDGRMRESLIHELCFAEYLDKKIYNIRSNE